MPVYGRFRLAGATSQARTTTVRLLGLVELQLDDQVAPLGAAKQRALLALLALHANEQVSAERLSDGLWGELQPASAPKMVQLYVSRLRKVLEGANAEILTRGRGYELRIAPAAVDALRFERAVEAGRGTEALALWRGPPLADVADEPFAAEQIRRLEDLWLRARELSIDAALERGDPFAALRDAEDVLAEHPFRERVHGQRMLALYRAGRQAESLEAYHEARHKLMDEVGIEPGPELRALNDAMLAQDPSLDLEAPPSAAVPPGPSRRRRWWVPALAAVLAAGVVAALVAATQSSAPDPVAVVVDSVAVIDPADNRVTADIPVEAGPGPIGSAEGHVWVLSLRSQTLTRIDAARRKVAETAGVGGPGQAGNLAVVPRNVWIAEGCQEGGQGSILRIDTTLRPMSIPENGVGIELDLGVSQGRAQPPDAASGPGCGLAALGRSIWIATPIPAGIARLDITPPGSPEAEITQSRSLAFVPSLIAAGEGSVWVRDPRASRIWRMDPRTLRRQRTVETGTDPTAIAFGAGAVWIANSGDGSVSRVDPRANASIRAISVGSAPAGIAVGVGSVWVANAQDGTVSRIDPSTNNVVATITLGHRPQAVAIADGAVWVTVRA
jgi:YVTN family beta-propeller protein